MKNLLTEKVPNLCTRQDVLSLAYKCSQGTFARFVINLGDDDKNIVVLPSLFFLPVKRASGSSRDSGRSSGISPPFGIEEKQEDRAAGKDGETMIHHHAVVFCCFIKDFAEKKHLNPQYRKHSNNKCCCLATKKKAAPALLHAKVHVKHVYDGGDGDISSSRRRRRAFSTDNFLSSNTSSENDREKCIKHMYNLEERRRQQRRRRRQQNRCC